MELCYSFITVNKSHERLRVVIFHSPFRSQPLVQSVPFTALDIGHKCIAQCGFYLLVF